MPDDIEKLKEVDRLLGNKSIFLELEVGIRGKFLGADFDTLLKQYKKMIDKAKKEQSKELIAQIKKTNKENKEWNDKLGKKHYMKTVLSSKEIDERVNKFKSKLDGMYEYVSDICTECKGNWENSAEPVRDTIKRLNRLILKNIALRNDDYESDMAKTKIYKDVQSSEAMLFSIINDHYKTIKTTENGLETGEKVNRDFWLKELDRYIKEKKFPLGSNEYDDSKKARIWKSKGEDVISYEKDNLNISDRIADVVEDIYKGELVLPGLDPRKYLGESGAFNMANDLVQACGAHTFMTPKERKDVFFLTGGNRLYNKFLRTDKDFLENEASYKGDIAGILKANKDKINEELPESVFNKETGELEIYKENLNSAQEETEQKYIWDLNNKDCIKLCNILGNSHASNCDKMLAVAEKSNRTTSSCIQFINQVKQDYEKGEEKISYGGMESLKNVNDSRENLFKKHNRMEEVEAYNEKLLNELKPALIKSIEEKTKKINAYELRKSEISDHFAKLFKAAKMVNNNWTKDTMLSTLMESIVESKQPDKDRKSIMELADGAKVGFFEKLLFWKNNQNVTKLTDYLKNMAKSENKSINEDELKEIIQTANELKESIEGNKKFNAAGKDLNGKIKQLGNTDKKRYELAVQVLEGIDANMKKQISDKVKAPSQPSMN